MQRSEGRDPTLMPCEYCYKKFPINCALIHIDMCGLRTGKCEFCDMFVLLKKKKEHLKVCIKNEKVCPHCRDTVSRENFEVHVGFCAEYKTACNFCKNIVLKELEQTHMEMECPVLMKELGRNLKGNPRTKGKKETKQNSADKEPSTNFSNKAMSKVSKFLSPYPDVDTKEVVPSRNDSTESNPGRKESMQSEEEGQSRCKDEENLSSVRQDVAVEKESKQAEAESDRVVSEKCNGQHECSFSEYRTLYTEGIFSDFTLVVGGRSFPVHRGVLSVKSDVFRSMFEADMRESKENSVEVVDVDPDTMDRLLRFIYFGEFGDLHGEEVAKLYFAADKYNVGSLKRKCADLLVSELTAKSVPAVLALADLHQDKRLEEAAKAFIFLHSREVFATDEWEELMNHNSVMTGKVMREFCLH